MERFLFVCSRNQWRSPTAEALFKRHPGVNARSAGTSPNARHTINSKDIQWADVIYVMEEKHKQRIKAEFARLLQHKPIIVLDILDNYTFMDPELIQELKSVLAEYF